jgi:hypothetical protein
MGFFFSFGETISVFSAEVFGYFSFDIFGTIGDEIALGMPFNFVGFFFP